MEIQKYLPGLALAILGTAFGMYWLINVDAAALLENSARLLDGEKLYQDVIEQQSPAIYLISLFVVWFSRVLHISAINGFFLFVFLLLNACIWASYLIFKQNGLVPFSNLMKTSRVDFDRIASGRPIPLHRSVDHSLAKKRGVVLSTLQFGEDTIFPLNIFGAFGTEPR